MESNASLMDRPRRLAGAHATGNPGRRIGLGRVEPGRLQQRFGPQTDSCSVRPPGTALAITTRPRKTSVILDGADAGLCAPCLEEQAIRLPALGDEWRGIDCDRHSYDCNSHAQTLWA